MSSNTDGPAEVAASSGKDIVSDGATVSEATRDVIAAPDVCSADRSARVERGRVGLTWPHSDPNFDEARLGVEGVLGDDDAFVRAAE